MTWHNCDIFFLTTLCGLCDVPAVVSQEEKDDRVSLLLGKSILTLFNRLLTDCATGV